MGKLLSSSSKPSQEKAASAALFIEVCLTRKPDPVERPGALDLMRPDWEIDGDACNCRWCAGD